jgi:hypothetical protein
MMPQKQSPTKGLHFCGLCHRPIKPHEALVIGNANREILNELAKDEIIGNHDPIRKYFHKSCIDSLPIVTRRRLLLQDWRFRCLNVQNEVWVKENDLGESIFSTIFSDIPEIDIELQKLKQKQNRTEKDKEWLRSLLNG